MRKSLAIGLGTLLIGGTVWAQQYLITTLAGGGLPPTPAPAVSTALGYTQSVATDADGNVYFTANNAVFKVDASGILTRVAGSSAVPGYSGDGGLATSAQVSYPAGVAVDAAGNLYIAVSSVIRKVAAATGLITTVAGNGTFGYSGDGGPATSAKLSPWGVAVDGSGNLYITDFYDSVIRKVAAATGIITTVAGNGTFGYSGDGGPATTAQLAEPSGVAVDGSGNLYIADWDDHVIRKVTAATGIITTVAGNGSPGYSGDGGPATGAQLACPWGVAVDGSGNLYLADTGYYRIRKVAAAGTITTVAGNGRQYAYSGDGGPATSAQLALPYGAAVDGSGNIYIADWDDNAIHRVAAATGIITTVAGNGSGGYSGDGGPATSAQLSGPAGVAADGSGNIYIADEYNNVIRKVAAATGIITTVAGDGTQGYSGDGGPATGAQLGVPLGVAVDGSGNLYIADSLYNRIRKVTAATGIITTVAGGGSAYPGDGGPATSARVFPSGVAVDGSGNLYIAEFYGSVIRKVTAATGIITTVAGNGTPGYSGDGGPASSAQLDQPQGVAVDGSGNLYIADNNAAIRKVAAATGIITTVAGAALINGYSGDGGPATSAHLNYPHGVAVDGSGNVYVADTSNNAIRMLVPVATRALLSITMTHAANFAPGQMDATYSVVVNNAAGAGLTSGTLTVTEIVPVGLTLVSMSGAGWDCSGATCTRDDALSPGATYPPITVTVNVAEDAPSQVLNQVTVSGGGAWPTGAGDLTTIFGVVLVSSGGVVNAASYTAPVAPGSIAAAFGNFLLASPIAVISFPIPTSLGGLSLQFGGAVLAPLFYAGPGQVNAQVPWELAGQSQTTITASINGQTSAPQTVNLATYAPGIFAANAEGTGPGAILDSNFQLVSATNPTTAGAIIQIYCTGLGPVTNQPATGAPSPFNPLASTTTWPAVTIGGAPATVQFSGLTPADVGLYQVNAWVPAASSKGAAVPVVIAIGGATSNTVTIAVQ
jgi:uncharacterized protein (TIGR03437 family)